MSAWTPRGKDMNCTSQPARTGWSSSVLSGVQPPSVFGLGLEKLVLQLTAADVIVMIMLLLAKELMTCPAMHISSSSLGRSAASSPGLALCSRNQNQHSWQCWAPLRLPATSSSATRAGCSLLASAPHMSVTFPSRSCRDVSCSPVS